MKKIVHILLFAAALASSGFAQQSGNELVFISDLQNPIWVEELVLPPHRNKEATDTLFSDIARRRPRALFMLGDIVSVGSDIYLWKDVDNNLNKLRKKRIPVYAVPGNHEYMFIYSFGILNFTKRFPNLPVNGYYRVIDSVAVVMLNSNIGYLNPIDYNIQLEFYKRIMAELDTTASVKFIIVATHHSPYTNSMIVDPSIDVQNLFVPIFEKTKKARLFLSGHSHNLEYFKNWNKNYLVIGGGGGLKQPLYKKGSRKYGDAIENIFKPMYFYITINRQGINLDVESRGITRDFIFFDYHIMTIQENP